MWQATTVKTSGKVAASTHPTALDRVANCATSSLASIATLIAVNGIVARRFRMANLGCVFAGTYRARSRAMVARTLAIVAAVSVGAPGLNGSPTTRTAPVHPPTNALKATRPMTVGRARAIVDRACGVLSMVKRTDWHA
jgi:outer membrane PBP1 activator LpoA protein